MVSCGTHAWQTEKKITIHIDVHYSNLEENLELKSKMEVNASSDDNPAPLAIIG